MSDPAGAPTPTPADDVEVQGCSVAVTSFSVTLNVQTADGDLMCLTMPRQIGENLAQMLRGGLDAVAPLAWKLA